MNSRDQRDGEALDALLRLARDLEPSGEHLREDSLQGWVEGTLSGEQREAASRHLSRCELCAMAAGATAVLAHESVAADASGDVIAFRIRHFTRLAPREDDKALAAASETRKQRTFESFRSGRLHLSLVVTPDGEVVATLTAGDHPLDAVPVRLMRFAEGGTRTLVALGATDSQGRVSFGSLSDLPWPGFGDWHELHVPTPREEPK